MKIIVRGGGDIASGTIHRLASAGFRVLILETSRPAAIRRLVSFSEAVYDGTATVEGKRAVLIGNPWECVQVWERGDIPLLVDPTAACVEELGPDVVVDAILAKRNLGTHRDMAHLTVGLGPGFSAGQDVDAVVETCRGHDLGRIIRSGRAKPDTGTPGKIGGFGRERVVYAPAQGQITHMCAIGDLVEEGQMIGHVEGTGVYAAISGVLRGLIREGYPVTRGMKIADVDPRMEQVHNCETISDKARCIAGSVLELVCAGGRR